MKRRTFTILVFLLLIVGGAIVNVAVAWGCTMRAYEHSAVVRPPNLREMGWWRTTPVSRYEPFEIQSSAVVGCEVLRINGHGPVVDTNRGQIEVMSSAYKSRAGFPLFSFTGQRFGVPHPPGMKWESPTRGAVYVGSREFFRYFPNGSPLLPWRPLWPGFAINTIFYAAILWGVFAAPFALRRWRRIRRGLCPGCAYPVGASDVCTECGEPVSLRPLAGQPRGQLSRKHHD